MDAPIPTRLVEVKPLASTHLPPTNSLSEQGRSGKGASQRTLLPSTLAPESGAVFPPGCVSERSRHCYWQREHPLAIFQAPGGDSNSIDLDRPQGLARGNPEFQIPKGMSGL